MWNVIFVGAPPNAFLLIDALSRVSSNMTCLRLDDLSTVKKHLFNNLQCRHIVIVDGSKADASLRDYLKTLRFISPCRIALAYKDLWPVRWALANRMYPVEVDGFFPWASNFGLQYECLRSLQLGLHPFPVEVPLIVETESMSRDAADPRLKLTPKERIVLRLMASGKMNKAIAAELSLSEHTVKLHVHHIITKLGVTNRTEAALIEARLRDQ